MLASRLLPRCNVVLPAVSSAAVAASRRKHTLPELTYGYKALEPTISGEIMELHHSKHHATYVNNLNAAEEQLKRATEAGKSGLVLVRVQIVRVWSRGWGNL